MYKIDKRHFLNDYILAIKEKEEYVSSDIRDNFLVEHISYNSKDIKESTLFVCKGNNFKRKYLLDAINRGVRAYISEVDYNVDIDKIIVKDIRNVLSTVAMIYYNNCHKNLKLIGITGTKGKTTTLFYLKQILELATNKKVGILSSITNFDGVVDEDSKITTKEPFELHKSFYNACKSDIEYMLVEVSSQGLKYNRVYGLTFEVVAFLNIGNDHISEYEHQSFEDYFESKLMIFDMAKKIFINSESYKYEDIIKKCNEFISFGLKDSDYVYYDIKTKPKISFKIKSKELNDSFSLAMPGVFNVSNATCAISISNYLGIDTNVIKEALSVAKVKGRMQKYYYPKRDLNIIVDYAHNEMSFKTLFDSTKKEYPNAPITVLFGCVGNAAKERRKELPKISEKNATLAIISEDNPYTEPLMKICKEIESNFSSDLCKVKIITDREKAVRYALKETEEGGVVLLLGMGQYDTQERMGVIYKVKTDSQVVLEVIEEGRKNE